MTARATTPMMNQVALSEAKSPTLVKRDSLPVSTAPMTAAEAVAEGSRPKAAASEVAAIDAPKRAGILP